MPSYETWTFRDRSFAWALGISLPPWTGTLGVALAVAGGILALSCVGTFVVRGRGTPAPFDAPRDFVAVGPYKYVRNPMYVGGLTLLAGLGLYLHSVAILVLSLALFLIVNLFVVFYEEPTLRGKFGMTYGAYCEAVNRWVPRVRGRREKVA
jgi:protein-S-isoprenylcysteine O-methyltransferase Ste14